VIGEPVFTLGAIFQCQSCSSVGLGRDFSAAVKLQLLLVGPVWQFFAVIENRFKITIINTDITQILTDFKKIL